MEMLQTILQVFIWFLSIPLVILILLQGGGDLSSTFGGGGQLDSSLGVGASQKMAKITAAMVILFMLAVIILAKPLGQEKAADMLNAGGAQDAAALEADDGATTADDGAATSEDEAAPVVPPALPETAPAVDEAVLPGDEADTDEAAAEPAVDEAAAEPAAEEAAAEPAVDEAAAEPTAEEAAPAEAEAAPRSSPSLDLGDE